MTRVLSMICILFLLSCQDQKCRESVEPVPVTLEVQRLDEELFRSASEGDVLQLLNENERFANLFLDADEYPSNEVLAGQIFTLLQNPGIDTLYQESQAAFEDLDGVISQIEGGLGRLKYYYPNAPTPMVMTAVTGLYKDLVITNQDIMIGMDFFIGKEASYPPQQIPAYILRRYDTQHLPANVIQFVSSQFIQQAKGESMLAEMVDHGKSYYLLSNLLPCTSENILIGYTQEEWQDSFDNDEIIWANFVQNELLYETNHQTKQKFLGERPNVYEIGDKCPGRIGRWLGWQIVKSYMDNNDVTMKELLEERDAAKIFSLSKYKPSGR